MTNRQYFEAKFLVDADQLERMMGKKLPADADKLQNKLNKARFGAAFKQAGKDTEAFHARLDAAGKGLQHAGRNLTLASAGVLAFGKIAVDAASDLNESVSKTDVVFGSAAGAVHSFAKTAATSIGQSQQQAEEAAGTFGNLFVSMKIGQPAAARMSISMVRLAGDLASFNNVSPEDALEALRSGLVGETEPLRKFGINLNDASLRAEATRLQLGHIGPTLTAQQKALASYSLILQQSKTAQGDFARTSGGLANQQRIMAAQFKDSSAALGKDFLPIAIELVGVVRNDVIPVITKAADIFAGLPKPVREVGLAALVAIGPLTFLTGKILSGVATLGKARAAWTTYRAAKVAQLATDAAVGTAEEALAAKTTISASAAAAASSAIGGRGFGLAAKTTGLLETFTRLTPALGTIGFGLVGLAVAYHAATTKTQDFHTVTQDQDAAVKRYGLTLGVAYTALNKNTATTKDNAKVAAEVEQKTTEYTLAITDLYPELDIATAKQIASTAASKDGAIRASASAQAIKDYAKALEEYQTKLDQVKTTVSGAIPVFEGFHTAGVKSSAKLREAIIKDLRQEVGGLTTWAADTQTLLKRGADPAFILELSQKGPEYVHAMATGSNTQLHLAERFFNERMKAIRNLSKQQLGLAGVEAPKALTAGLNAGRPKVSAAALQIAAAERRPLAEVVGFARTTGANAAAGLAQGFGSKKAHRAVFNATHGTVSIIEGESRRILRIESPSKVMFHIGEQAALGLAAGIRAKTEVVHRATGGMINLSGLMARGLSAAEAWIIQHESGGSVLADNPISTAFGLGQLLLDNRQRIGGILGFSPSTTSWAEQLAMFRYYYRERYGTAENAKAFWQAHGWYGSGLQPTVFSRPTLIGVGERGPETVSVTPGRGGGSASAAEIGQAVARALHGTRVVLDGEQVGRLIVDPLAGQLSDALSGGGRRS